jgi:hypothetical protein
MGIKNAEFEAYFESAKNCNVIHAKSYQPKSDGKCHFILLLLCAKAYKFLGASILAIFQRIQNPHQILCL